MPSLRQKVTTYFRQLSFIAEPRDGGVRSPRGKGRHGAHNDNDDEGNFIIKYLEGRMERHFTPPPPDIVSGREAGELPALPLATYQCGPHTITAASTGPDEGLCGIKRSKLHLSASYADDIDFIDTNDEEEEEEKERENAAPQMGALNNGRKATPPANQPAGRPLSGAIKQQRALGSRKLSNGSLAGAGAGSDQNANKLIGSGSGGAGGGGGGGGMRSRKNSRTSISNLKEAASRTPKSSAATPGKSTTIVVSMVSTSSATSGSRPVSSSGDQNNRNILNAPPSKATPTKGSAAATKPAAGDTTNLLAATTERLLQAAMTNETAMPIETVAATVAAVVPPKGQSPFKTQPPPPPLTSPPTEDAIAGVSNWQLETDFAYGVSVSLYELHQLTKTHMGSPIADCYGVVARGDAAIMALADGVNWGDGARLAARSAVHGCLDYLDRALFGQTLECRAADTRAVFVSLLRSLWEGHGCILEVGGALSTLTVAVVLPLLAEQAANSNGGDQGGNKAEAPGRRYVVCACNVGDSLGYVYSQRHGVREFTQASHDISSMRDMRDALGALGPADGNQPELSNLTLSLTTVEQGDIVFLTSDGVSDNFDPVVGKFAEAWTPDVQLMASSLAAGRGGVSTGGSLAPKRQNKSASALYARLHRHDPPQPGGGGGKQQRAASPSPPSSSVAAPSRPKYMRSHTVIEPRRLSGAGSGQPSTRIVAATPAAAAASSCPPARRLLIPRSLAGLPLVTGPQRHALTLHRLEDMLSFGINGTFAPCVSARRLCHLLMDFVRMMTSARRKTLEQRELFYKLSTGGDGVRREVALNRLQHRAARKRVVDSSAFVALPGKLDHATIVAYIAGGSSAASSVGGGGGVGCDASNGGGGGGDEVDGGLRFGSPRRAPLKSQEFYETNF